MDLDDQTAHASGYSDWKGWGSADFGRMARGDADHFSRELREIARRTPIRRVLEIGFGNGVFLSYCRSQGWDVTGTELLPELVASARAAGYSAYPANELPNLPDGSFDLVVALDVFEHIPPDQSIDFLQTISAKLTADGALLLRFPNVDTWIGNPLQYGDVTHVNAVGALKIHYYAGETGLAVSRIRAAKRRGFHTSVIHGLHAYTAGILIKVSAGIAKALYFPDLPVVLSSSTLVCVLRKAQERS
jgi:SAM-dependent methyltransferase